MHEVEPYVALQKVADLFSDRAAETILCENRYKHAYEIERIRTAAGVDGTICDLGGGLGVNLLTLRALGHEGRLILVDRFDEYDSGNRMGSFAGARTVVDEYRIEVVHRDFWADATLPLDAGSVDVATCFDVVEHLPGHPLRQLRELHRLLRPGGLCLISGPNSVSLMKRLKLLSGEHPYTPLSMWLEDPFYEHFREYSEGEYAELLTRAGFDSVRTHASAAVTQGRARSGYHRRPLSPLSPVRLALWGLAAVESAVPSLRHTVYAWGTRNTA